MVEPYTLKTCETIGRTHGEELARNVVNELDLTEVEGPFYVGQHGEVYEDARDAFWAALHDSSDHFRQFSPFEFHAAAINARPGDSGPEVGWERYERGFERGARAALRALGRHDLL